MTSKYSYTIPVLLVTVVVFFSRVAEVKATFEDVRCKCVCPKISPEKNSSRPAQAVYIKNVEPNQCKCGYVVPSQNPQFCSRCECKYESRNTTTIKVVVIFIICIVSLLFVYMMFLLCLEPLIARRPAHYSEHADEEEDMTSRIVPEETAAALRQRSLLNRVSEEQKKWKGTVQEQRRNIYDRHSMLN